MDIYIIPLVIAFTLGLVAMYLYCKSIMVSKVLHAVLQTGKEQDEQIIKILNQQIITMQTTIKEQLLDINKKEVRIAEINAMLAATENSITQHKKDIQEMQDQLKLHFQNISNDLLTKQASIFGEQSSKAIGNLLEPFKSEMKTINDTIKQETRTKMTLEGAIKQVVESNAKISLQAENFAKALKGDNKIQGNWGEIMLEKILEESGLRKDLDYTLQAENMGLKNSEHRTVRPDVIVNLPDNKHIIIDSKVSLTDYERYISAPNDENRELHLNNFLSSVKRHVKSLSEKSYHDVEKINSPDFVLMFLCIEGAYTLAIQKDLDIHSYAWDKKIVVVCPSTLYTTLRTINAVWRLELQNQNALAIAKKGGAIYDKLVALVEDLIKVGLQLETVKKTYNNSMSKLSTGSGNLLSKAEGLRKLGIKCNKKLPIELIKKDDNTDHVEETSDLYQGV